MYNICASLPNYSEDQFMTEHSHSTTNVLENIRAVSELIFDVLYREGDMELGRLKQEVKHESPVFDWAIGWLIGKDDIEVVSANGSYTVRRNGPTPAVFPIRGN
jgi:hypothetical protein